LLKGVILLKARLIFFGLILALILSFMVLYPQPMALVISFQRLFNLPIDYQTELMKPLLKATFNQDPSWIEAFVEEQIPYQHDWQVYNYPWYFPSVEEVLNKGFGDCKSKLIVQASIFTFHEIPFSFSASISHFWLNYEEKEETRIESSKKEMVSHSQEKGLELKKPEVDWKETSRVLKKAGWDSMSWNKKVLLYQVWLSSLFFTFFSIIIVSIKEAP
jgi:hypothetical protein